MRISDWSSDVCSSDLMQKFMRGFMPMAFALAVVGLLLLAEPDLGAFMVIVAIAVGILFIGGINGKLFSLLLTILMLCFLALIWASPWRRERLFVYLDPWNPSNAYGSAYQLRSEENTSELQSLKRKSYAVYRVKKKKDKKT